MNRKRVHQREDGAGRKEPRLAKVFSQRSVGLLIATGLVGGLVLAVLPPDWHEGFRIGGVPMIHIVGFAAAMFGAALLLGGGWRLLSIAGGLFLYGALIEIAQTQVDWRSDKLSDLGYNGAGIAAGVALYVLLAGICRAWRYRTATRKSRI